MATMNISMPKEMAEFVEGEVASGDYSSSSEVVREALRLLRHEKAQEREKLAILKREIGIAIEEMEAGKTVRISASDIAREILEETNGK